MPGKLHFRVAAFIYFVLGALCLWWFLTLLLPLAEARMQFEKIRTQHEYLAPLREPLRPLLGSGPNGVVNPQLQSLLDQLQKAGVPAELAKQLLTAETEFERYESLAKADFEEAKNATKPDPNARIPDPDATKLDPKDPTKPVPDASKTIVDPQATVLLYPDLPKRMPPSSVFKAYLAEKHEALYANFIVRSWATLESWNLMLRAFIGLSLGAGLLGGCIRLFGFGRAGRHASKTDDLIWPLATPVLALFVVMLLTGFGRIFKTEIDPATSKFLMILVAAIALSPEVFLTAIRRYVFDLLMEFKSTTRDAFDQYQTEYERHGSGPVSEEGDIAEALRGVGPAPAVGAEGSASNR